MDRHLHRPPWTGSPTTAPSSKPAPTPTASPTPARRTGDSEPARGSCPGTTTDAGEAVGGRPEPSADLLRQLDDDSLRAADVAEPVAVLVALHPANELRAAGSQPGDGGVDIVDCECDMADARGVRRRVPVAAPARRGVKLRQLEPCVAVRGLHHRDLRPDALEPHHAVHPTALDRPLALQLESELDEERRRGREVVDHDAHVLHALDRHALDGSGTTAPSYTAPSYSVPRLPIGWWERAAHWSEETSDELLGSIGS